MCVWLFCCIICFYILYMRPSSFAARQVSLSLSTIVLMYVSVCLHLNVNNVHFKTFISSFLNVKKETWKQILEFSRKGSPRFLPRVVWVWPNQRYHVFVVFIMFSFTELCIFLCRFVLSVSTWAKWLAGKTYSRDIFHVEGFSHKDQIEELFPVMVYCVYSQHATLSTFSD